MPRSRTAAVMDDDDLMGLANQVKEIVVDELVRQDLLDVEEADRFVKTNTILVTRKGWLGSAIDRMLGYVKGGRRENGESIFLFANIPLVTVTKDEPES